MTNVDLLPSIPFRLLLVCVTFILAAHPLPAQESATPAADTPAVDQLDAIYALKYRSEFQPRQIERNPFWPIGWTPVKEDVDATPRETIPTVDPKLFRLSSVLTGAPAIAVIDGRDYVVGDTFTKTVQGSSITFRVKAIRDGFVDLEYADGRVVTIEN